ncbi:MAG: hypothetical protein O6933_09700, partial [Planctomycetota bacterium]|nr:hypothetical protein [Planctomycetota bacterium]
AGTTLFFILGTSFSSLELYDRNQISAGSSHKPVALSHLCVEHTAIAGRVKTQIGLFSKILIWGTFRAPTPPCWALNEPRLEGERSQAGRNATKTRLTAQARPVLAAERSPAENPLF